MKLSAVIITKNEEKNLGRLLVSLGFCDEIIVIDDYSQDKTADLAQKKEAIVHKRKLNDNFAQQRNFGFEKSRGDWTLFIDADEEVTDELAREIKSTISAESKHDSYYIKRRDFWWGKELKFGEIRPVRKQGLIRLVKKGSGHWVGSVHEEFHSVGPPGRLKGFLNHYPHPTLKEFLSEINFYTTLRADQLKSSGKKVNILEIIAYPLAKFLHNYFLRLGFLDGPRGFAYAFLMSFHSFLVRAKLYQYTKID